jgi:dihydrofolate reductase
MTAMNNLSLIVAYSTNQVIGVDNTMPWHLPEDLKRFRALTTGHHIIMGRKTYESLGRLLPDRTTVIVTRNQDYKVEGAVICHSLEEAVQACTHDDEAFIIGGAELYQKALDFVSKLYVTEVHLEIEGDAFFPKVDEKIWQPIAREALTSTKGFDFNYVTYERVECIERKGE